MTQGTTEVLDDAAPGETGESQTCGPLSEPDRTSTVDRRRFAVTMGIAVLLAAIPFVWILWVLWGSADPVRNTIYQTNFYDLQAWSMLHGHLWIPNGSIGIEAFVHGGRQFTYFGLFPSIIRMPFLLISYGVRGKLTTPFILVAWLVTALFASLLLWRIRVLLRGTATLGRAELVSYGVVMATIMGGSVWLILAATPYVFNEDLAWSICLTTGSVFALLGVLERPSWGRVAASGGLILAANLDRVTTGWACSIGAVLIAVWFAVGRGGKANRRWWAPLLGAGLVPVLIGCAVNYAKFGMAFGIPVPDQVYSMVNVYRRKFLAANHNSEVGTAFIPTNLVAYLRPDGLRFTSVFPFITLPASPNPALGGVLFDKRYRTASLPASMPLLFLLGCWGMVTAFRPKPVGRAGLTRPLLLATGIACAALLLWGYIGPRYLADFMPFLILAGFVAIVDIWRRLTGRSRRVRILWSAVIAAIALFEVVANIGMAISPTEEWSITTQALQFVQAQKTVSDLTGGPIAANVEKGSALPEYAPADRLFIVGNCDGLYISTGESYATVPSQLFTRTTWLSVERGHQFQHSFVVSVARPASMSPWIQLVSGGLNTVSVAAAPAVGNRSARVLFKFSAPGRIVEAGRLVPAHSAHDVQLIMDRAKHDVRVSVDGKTLLEDVLVTSEPIRAGFRVAHTGGRSLTVVNTTNRAPQPELCDSLLRS